MSSFKPSQRRQRHSAPSGPWPFVDLADELDERRLEQSLNQDLLSAEGCEHKQTGELCWCKYPQSRYPNWTLPQQKKSRLLEFINGTQHCIIRYLDVNSDGMFVDAPQNEVNTHSLDKAWLAIQAGRPANVRLRMLFVDNCSGPVLQMIGTRYNIEPFYFSSTIGWTPCRFQSNVVANKSDHLTVIFTFIRSTRMSTTAASSLVGSYGSSRRSTVNSRPELAIDAQKPLELSSNKICLRLDRLALHMVRSRATGTIISLHPPKKHQATTAEQLHTRVHLTGKSVYWCNIFKDASDPTFVFLSYFWYAIYAWDEALENLYSHICYLEKNSLSTDKWDTTQELHDIRARLQYYASLLVDITSSVKFLQETPNPSLGIPIESDEEDVEVEDSPVLEKPKTLSQELMDRECKTLCSEIDRLERTRHLMELRLKNVMTLTFGRIQIQDNKQRQRMTEASMSDNAVMKLLTHLTIFFLPAEFCANLWSMNTHSIFPKGFTSVWEYFAVTLPLAFLSMYVITAYQLEIEEPRQQSSEVSDEDTSDQMTVKQLTFWHRVFWPIVMASVMMDMMKAKTKKGKSVTGLPN